jgi:plasmid stabilization system protein ParE
MGVRYSAAAKHELADAAQYYDRHRSGLGIELLNDVRRVAKLLDENPELGKDLSLRCRSMVLTRFPFRLVYELTDTGVRILAIAHQQRRPDYWRVRVEELRPHYAVRSQAAAA